MSYKRLVRVMTLDEKRIVGYYECIPVACKILGIKTSNVHKAANGERDSAQGYKWKYVEEVEYNRGISKPEPKREITDEYWLTFEKSILASIMHLPEKNIKSINLKLTTYLNL